VGLADEVVSQEALQGISERQVVSEAANEGREFEFVLF